MALLSREKLRRDCRGTSVGLYAAPLGELSDAIGRIVGWGGRIVHFDVMDGVFVPQVTAGPAFVAALGDGLVRDVHLMVADPAAQVDAFAEAGADIISVHAEAKTAKAALAAVRAAAMRLDRPILAGLAVMPDTPLDNLAPLLDPMPDLLLVLALDPRDGMPADLDRASKRLSTLAEMVAPARPLMAIDGGVTEDSVGAAVQAGPDMIVSGSAVFRAPEPATAFRNLETARAAHMRPLAEAEAEHA